MKKTIITYGLSLALLAFVLKLIEYNLLARDVSSRGYITIIAIVSVILGVWLGRKLSTPKMFSFSKFRMNVQAAYFLEISREELEILALVAEGLTYKEIATKLLISKKTVKDTLAQVYVKLDVEKKDQAIEKAKVLSIIY